MTELGLTVETGSGNGADTEVTSTSTNPPPFRASPPSSNQAKPPENAAAQVPRIEVDYARHPEAAQHLMDTNKLGRRKIQRVGVKTKRAKALKGKAKVRNKDLDEAPPAFLRGPDEEVSVRPIDKADNRGSGASMGNQARKYPENTEVDLCVINCPDVPKVPK